MKRRMDVSAHRRLSRPRWSVVMVSVAVCLGVNEIPAQDPICAQVRIQISQEAVLTRTAFEATLTVVNNSDSPLTNLRVDLDI